jgi:SpoVK/Ycf46/Vps4 family AAA+-type ATPase
MGMTCAACAAENRDTAKFCKRCGAPLDQAVRKTDGILKELVGLDEIKGKLSELQAILEGMRASGTNAKPPYNSIIIGNSGTAKTLIGGLIASLFDAFGLIQDTRPVTVDAGKLSLMDQAELDSLFSRAKGSILFIDNIHKLVSSSGDPEDAIDRIVLKMDEVRNDPIVILAGLPFGLKDFVKKPESKNFTGRFQNIFMIPDYTPAQYVELVSYLLKRQGFMLAEGSPERLLARFRYLFKEAMKPNSTVTAYNGYLALQETQAMQASYFTRKGTDKLILPADIKGKVAEKKTIEQILASMDKIIGMDSVKQEIRDLYAQIEQKKKMREMGKKTDITADHYLLMGNPGTGKTTVARLLGEIFEGLGLLEQGHVVEVVRDKIVGQYIGQTAIQMNEFCDKALGGILFIDEAYSLAQPSGSGADYGKEAIETLLTRMENDRGKFVVIAAGYQGPIENQFLKANEGLPSRFRKRFILPDYKPEELTAIFANIAVEQSYVLLPETEAAVLEFFKDRCARKGKDFANAREARNLVDEACRAQSQRLSKLIAANAGSAAAVSDDEYVTIRPEDVPKGTASGADQSLDEVLAELNALQGLSSVKDSITRIYNRIQAQKLAGETEVIGKHYQFLGNPGTGKTTVARIMAKVFHSIGMLPTDKLVEVARDKLVAQFTGQTAPLVNQRVDEALGGVLFIDEAYTLNQGHDDKWGHEAIDTLLKRLEDDKGKFVAIIAGYTQNMDAFISTNPGLKSRFSERILFEDYSPDELFAAFKSMAKKKNVSLGPGFEEALAERLQDLYTNRSNDFGNMRTIRQIFEASEENKAGRIMALQKSGMGQEELRKEVRIFQVEDLDHTVSG